MKVYFHVRGGGVGFGYGEMLRARPIEEMVLVDNLLKVSGSSKDTSGVFAGLEDKKVRFVPPLRARSRFDGILWREWNSSSSRLSLVVDEI